MSFRRPLSLTALLAIVMALTIFPARPSPVAADHTPDPTSVTIAGSFQQELGCPGDWQPACATPRLTYDANDTVWQDTFTIPAGSWNYKAAMNGTWDESYGQGGGDIPLAQAATGPVKFYYDHTSHWVTSNKNSIIATIPGSFQSELGCSNDWNPDCLRSWLKDLDGDGTYVFTTTMIPAGNYNAKVAINESWAENYGVGGAPNGADIPFTVPANGAEIYFEWDSVSKVLTISDGAPQGNIGLAKAHWVTADTIAWNANVAAEDKVRLRYTPNGGLTLTPSGITGGSAITLTLAPAGLSVATKAKFPHLASYKAFKIAPADLPLVKTILKGQFAIEAFEPTMDLIDATSLQIPGVLDDLYTYNGDLGVSFNGVVPTFRLWAPTAKSVKLHVFDDALPATTSTIYTPTLDLATGVWSYPGAANWQNKYYLYEVEVFVRSTGQVERNLVTDPYSFSLSTNSTRSQIINLDNADLKPAGWDTLAKPALAAPEDIVIYELHVRDFSINDPTVPITNRGTFKAFTNLQSNGMRHLSKLADAGLTHIHLLPVFDIATIEENKALRQEPDWNLLATYPMSSTMQQAAVDAVRDQDGFNWGYDPYHYTVPEGSYATNPEGATRIYEFREMVQSLNQSGLHVVMDVVYNHTNASGQNEKSVLDRIVPGYYHRLNDTGNVETSTCCQNTATEHAMMEKLMVDSLETWATEYKVDGFRFDLMGHHMKSNILKVRDTLQSLTLQNDGVDGSKIYIYGEGWNFGEVASNQRGVNATQLNMPGTGIGTFSDRLRDAVRGGGPFSGLREQGFINGLFYDPNGVSSGSPTDQRNRLLLHMDQIRVGLTGNLRDFSFQTRTGVITTGANVDYNGQPAGYTLDPQEVITYVEAHDNETLFDAIQLKAPITATLQTRVRMHNMGMSVVSLAQGVPFFQAGQDALRSKSLDRNSYNSGDWFNKLDWTFNSNNWGVGLPPAENQPNWPLMEQLLGNPALKPTQTDILSGVNHFQEMLHIRKSSKLFRLETAAQVQEHLSFLNTGTSQTPGLIVMQLTDSMTNGLDPKYDRIVTLFNASDEPATFTAAGLVNRKLQLHSVQANSADPVVRSSQFNKTTGTFTIPPRTTAVFVEIAVKIYLPMIFR